MGLGSTSCRRDRGSVGSIDEKECLSPHDSQTARQTTDNRLCRDVYIMGSNGLDEDTDQDTAETENEEHVFHVSCQIARRDPSMLMNSGVCSQHDMDP